MKNVNDQNFFNFVGTLAKGYTVILKKNLIVF